MWNGEVFLSSTTNVIINRTQAEAAHRDEVMTKENTRGLSGFPSPVPSMITGSTPLVLDPSVLADELDDPFVGIGDAEILSTMVSNSPPVDLDELVTEVDAIPFWTWQHSSTLPNAWRKRSTCGPRRCAAHLHHTRLGVLPSDWTTSSEGWCRMVQDGHVSVKALSQPHPAVKPFSHMKLSQSKVWERRQTTARNSWTDSTLRRPNIITNFLSTCSQWDHLHPLKCLKRIWQLRHAKTLTYHCKWDPSRIMGALDCCNSHAKNLLCAAVTVKLIDCLRIIEVHHSSTLHLNLFPLCQLKNFVQKPYKPATARKGHKIPCCLRCWLGSKRLGDIACLCRPIHSKGSQSQHPWLDWYPEATHLGRKNVLRLWHHVGQANKFNNFSHNIEGWGERGWRSTQSMCCIQDTWVVLSKFW